MTNITLSIRKLIWRKQSFNIPKIFAVPYLMYKNTAYNAPVSNSYNYKRTTFTHDGKAFHYSIEHIYRVPKSCWLNNILKAVPLLLTKPSLNIQKEIHFLSNVYNKKLVLNYAWPYFKPIWIYHFRCYFPFIPALLANLTHFKRLYQLIWILRS